MPQQDFAKLSKEELQQAVIAEMRALDEFGAGMRLEIHPASAFAVVAMVQLALRHPAAGAGDSALFARHFVHLVSGKFAGADCPATVEAIRRGDEPAHDDEPREQPQT